MGTDEESENEVHYAPMDALVKGWVEATLPECGGLRLTIIAKAYGLSGFAKLNKEPLYHLIYDHMLTVEDCEQCKGDCNPTKHNFPPIEVAPPEATTSPVLQWRTRKGSKALSPTAAVTAKDASPNEQLNDTKQDAKSALFAETVEQHPPSPSIPFLPPSTAVLSTIHFIQWHMTAMICCSTRERGKPIVVARRKIRWGQGMIRTGWTWKTAGSAILSSLNF